MSDARGNHILIIEDEPKLAELMRDYLLQSGFTAEIVGDGARAVPRLRQGGVDLALLDVMLPGRDGMEILRELRTFSSLPVIMVTARVEEIDRLLGLELGADDYVCKPFSPREVVARVKAVLRRFRLSGDDGASELRLDPARYEAHLDGKAVSLTRTEFNLLQRLTAHPGHIHSRHHLIDAIYDDHRVVTDRTVDSHVRNLRRKLLEAKPDRDLIHSVYGVGDKDEWERSGRAACGRRDPRPLLSERSSAHDTFLSSASYSQLYSMLSMRIGWEFQRAPADKSHGGGGMRRVQLGDIRIGSPLPWTVYDGKGTVLLRKGVVLTSSNQLDKLIRNGLFIDERSSRNSDNSLPPARESDVPVYDRVKEYQDQLDRIHKQLLRGGAEGIPARIGALVGRYRALCREDGDTVLAALHLGSWSYGLAHAAHVAVLAELLAAKKGVSEEERVTLFSAALTHDVGILYIQEELDRQPELTEEQWKAVRTHPSQSCEILTKAGVDDDLWLRIVRDHHERLDGSGYERGIEGQDIPLLARILSVCDIYSAMIRPRPYRNAILARDALRDIFLSRGRSVDDALAQSFIKELGIFPPGGLVRLQNGEVGVIARRGEDRTKPLVRVVIGPRGMPLARYIERDTSRSGFAIKEMVSHYEFPWIIQNLHVVCGA